MAKNKNQSRQQRDQRGERSRPATDAAEHGKGVMTEEHVMPAATQVARKQQKRFGHN